MSLIASSGIRTALVEAVVYPRCVCGQPFPAHAPEGCTGYRPSRPIEPLGIVAYTHRSRICRAMFAVETFVRRRRLALERRFS